MSSATREAYQADVDQSADRGLFIEGTEYATIGWENVAEIVDVGTGGDDTSEDSATLVRITLFRGKQIGTDIKPGVGQGHRALAFLLGPLYYVPSRNKRVLISWPQKVPGAPAIIHGPVVTTPAGQFSQTRAKLDVGADHELVISGSVVTLMDHGKDESPTRFASWLSVGRVAGGEPGITCSDPSGDGFVVSNGTIAFYATDKGSPPTPKVLLELKGSTAAKPGFAITYAGQAIIQADGDGNLSVGCGKALALVGAQVLLGASASPMTPVLYGFVGPTGAPSTSVFVSM